MKKRKQLLLSVPLLMIASISWAERSGFYTIIGPDGHIIVIDRNAAEPKPSAKATHKPSVATKIKKDEVATATSQHRTTIQAPNVVSVPKSPTVLPEVVQKKADKTAASIAKKDIILPKIETSDTTQTEPSVAAPVNASVPTASIVANNSVAQKATVVTPVVAQAKDSVAVKKAAVIESNKPEIKTAHLQAQDKSPIDIINGEQYIESEYLEQKEFNLEGKKRFYSLPDGLGGNQLVEREKGLDMSVFRGPQIKVPKVVTLSKDYQRVPAQNIANLTGTQCFSEEQLKKTKPLKENITTDFWPRASFEPKFDFVVAEFEQALSDIELTSYANTMKNPKFYWPLPVFLDSKGCVLEGVNAFYLRTLSPTISHHQAIQGYLHVPDGAKYLLLTPLEAAADLDHIQLTNQGQIRLTPIR